MKLDDRQRPAVEALIHRIYRKVLLNRVRDPLGRQRLKMLWFAPGYWPLFVTPSLRVQTRLMLLARFLRIDWNVLHGHVPFQCAAVCRALAQRPADPGEALVEAGCWLGGSSAKWSIICKVLGYQLAVYDSFEGVKDESHAEGEHDYSGEYAATEHDFWENVKRYGDPDVCRVYPGWFSETMAAGRIPFKVRVAYIDCDTAQGTKEALRGIVPALAARASIFSQDCHIASVLKLLTDPTTWKGIGTAVPAMTRIDRRLVRFEVGTETPSELA